MSITIKAEKIIVRGKRLVEIKSLSLLTRSELPVVYFKNDVDYCFLDNDGDMGVHPAGKGKDTTYYKVRMHMEEADFNSLLAEIKICGTRLQIINARLAKENADWHGKETFII